VSAFFIENEKSPLPAEWCRFLKRIRKPHESETHFQWKKLQQQINPLCRLIGLPTRNKRFFRIVTFRVGKTPPRRLPQLNNNFFLRNNNIQQSITLQPR
jgi:hypothetical protein